MKGILDGDVFDKDGWIYNNGEKRRKWHVNFGQCGEFRIWEPKLNDLAALEATYWRINAALLTWWDQVWEPLKQKCRDAGKCGGLRVAKDKGINTPLWIEINRYNEHEENLDDYSPSWSWTESKDEPWGTRKPDVVNQALIDEYVAWENRWHTFGHRLYVAKEAFVRAVEKKYWKGNYGQLHLMFGENRHYWWTINQAPTREMLTKISWPTDSRELQPLIEDNYG